MKKTLELKASIATAYLFDTRAERFDPLNNRVTNYNCDCYTCQCDGGCDCVCQGNCCDAGPCYS